MMNKSLKIVSLLVVIIMVASSFSSTVSKHRASGDVGQSLDLKDYESMPELQNDEFLDVLSEDPEEDTKGTGSNNPTGTISEYEVEWGKISLDGIRYKVMTYWTKDPYFFPGYYTPNWEDFVYEAELLRVAIYELYSNGAIKEFVTDVKLKQEIITAIQIQGWSAYENEKLDIKAMMPGKYEVHDWIEDRHNDWFLAMMNEIDDTLLADEEDLSEKGIYKLLIVKTIDEEGCSPLSKEDYFSESEWYKDFFGIADTFVGDEYKELTKLLNVAEDSIDIHMSLEEMKTKLNPFNEHCDIIIEAVWETYNFMSDLYSLGKDYNGWEYPETEPLEISMDALDAFIRAVWEVKIVEKYADSLKKINKHITNSKLKSAINDLTSNSFDNVWAHITDVIWEHVEKGARKIGKKIIKKAVMKHPYIAAAVLGLDIGLLISKYLVVDFDEVKGHSNVAHYLRKAERGFLDAINGGLRQEVTSNEEKADYLAAYNLAERLQLMASLHFYKEAQKAVEAYKLWNPFQDKNDVKKDIKNSIKNREEYVNYKIPWLWDSGNDIDYVLSLIRPMPNLHVDPSTILITPNIPQFREAFDVNVVVENKGDDSPDFYVYLGIIDKSAPYKIKTFYVPYLIGLGKVQYIPITMREKNVHQLDLYHVEEGLKYGESININFELKNGIWNEKYAGYNSLAVSYKFYLDGEWHSDRVYKGIKINRNPYEPVLISPKVYASSKPRFEFMASDPDGDDLTYELYVEKKDGSWGNWFNQDTDNTGWSKDKYRSGEIAVFEYSDSPLSDDEYLWWVRVHDDTSSWIDSDDEDFKIDTTPPATSHYGHKGDYISNWSNDWYNGDIALEAFDYGSGVANTNYRINDGAWVTTAETQDSSVVVIDYDCNACKLDYYSTDNAGNVENTHTNYINVDLTKPILDYSITGVISVNPDSEGNHWRCGGATVNLRPVDDPPSGRPNDVASAVGLLHYKTLRNDEFYDEYIDYKFSDDSDQKVAFSLPNDGLYKILYHIMDYAYNFDSIVIEVRIDANPPYTTISNPDGIGDWYKSYPALISVDEGAGVKEVHYHIVGEKYVDGVWEEYDSGEITEVIDEDIRELRVEIPLDDGDYTIKYYALDDVGYEESEKSDSIKIDGHAPITTYEISEEPDFNGWYNRNHPNLTINLSTVEIGPSGYWYTNISFFDGATDELKGFYNSTDSSSSYNVSWLFNADGINRVFYRSGDNAGNVEDRPYKLIRIDRTPPTTSSEIFDAHSDDPLDSWVGISFYSDDATSGVAYLKYRIDGGEWQTMFDHSASSFQKHADFTLYLPDNQMYVIDYYAVDNANHSESVKTIYILPDLRVLYKGIWMEGGNLYVEIENKGYVDAHDVPVHLYGVVTSPNDRFLLGEYYLNSVIVPEVRAKKSAVACFLPREYIGLYNEIKVVIELDNITLPEYRKDNNEATKFIKVLLYEWVVTTKEEIENTIIVVPPPLCKPLIIEENGKLTFKYSDMIIIEPCPYSLPSPESISQGIQVDSGGILELINSGITVVNDVRKMVVDIAGYLIARGKGTLKTLLILAKNLWIQYQEGTIKIEPQPMPSIWDILDNLRNAEPAFEPSPLPTFTGELAFTINPAYNPQNWVITPALPPPEDVEVMVATDTNLKLVNTEVVMKGDLDQVAVLTVQTGAKLYLIDSTVTGGVGVNAGHQFQANSEPNLHFKFMGGGEIIQVNSQIRDHITYGIKLETSSPSNYVDFGETTEYQLIVTNDGNVIDTFDLKIETHIDETLTYDSPNIFRWDANLIAKRSLDHSTSSVWQSWLDTYQVTLAPAQSASVTLYVKAPLSRPDDEEMLRETTFITAQSQGDNEKSSTLIVKTTIADEPSLLKGSNNNNMIYSSAVELGEWTSYNIQIENPHDRTRVLDFFALDIPNGWLIMFKKPSERVPPGGTRTITVMVRGPFECCLMGDINSRIATIVIYVESDDDELSATIIIADAPRLNDPPVIHIEPFKRMVWILENVAFFACRSTDPDGRIINFRWDFVLGEGYRHTVYGGIAVHSFLNPGRYDVVLRVTDDYGTVVDERTSIEVQAGSGDDSGLSDLWNAVIGCGCTIIAGENGFIKVSKPNPSVYEQITICVSKQALENGRSFTWDLGDGGFGFGPIVVHSYFSTGIYNIGLWIADYTGSSTTDFTTIIIGSSRPNTNFQS